MAAAASPRTLVEHERAPRREDLRRDERGEQGARQQLDRAQRPGRRGRPPSTAGPTPRSRIVAAPIVATSSRGQTRRRLRASDDAGGRDDRHAAARPAHERERRPPRPRARRTRPLASRSCRVGGGEEDGGERGVEAEAAGVSIRPAPARPSAVPPTQRRTSQARADDQPPVPAAGLDLADRPRLVGDQLAVAKRRSRPPRSAGATESPSAARACSAGPRPSPRRRAASAARARRGGELGGAGEGGRRTSRAPAARRSPAEVASTPKVRPSNTLATASGATRRAPSA